MKILVVDDEPDIPLLFSQYFKHEIQQKIMDFTYASSAEEALALLKKRMGAKVMLILSDINMPGMNGLELLKIVKKQYPNIAVVMITAYGDERNSQVAWENGAEEIISKPLNLLYLKNVLMEFISLYESQGNTGRDNDENSHC